MVINQGGPLNAQTAKNHYPMLQMMEHDNSNSTLPGYNKSLA